MAQKKMGRPPTGDKPMKERIFVLVNDETNIVRKGIDRVFDDLQK